MMRKTKALFLATLATVATFFAASPANAQGIVSAGSGSYLSPSDPTQTSSFVHLIQEGRGGTVQGTGIWFFPNSTVVVDITSYEHYEFTPGTTSLAFAGTISAIYGTPSNPLATVGRTIFVAVNDNGFGVADETSGLSLLPPLSALPPVPPQFGDLSTIQQLLGFFEFYGFPSPTMVPLISGNIRNR